MKSRAKSEGLSASFGAPKRGAVLEGGLCHLTMVRKPGQQSRQSERTDSRTDGADARGKEAEMQAVSTKGDCKCVSPVSPLNYVDL